ncbi:MAG TPA: PPOX class F420-dependent oxidoreductase [Myxococcota bacterium]|nr:PPOX class F420-dependent oxidoreductase [Myxococcota bacterium]
MLESERYLSLATFRRDGREVATPIWFAHEGGAMVAFSAGDAGKVKRLRNSPRARVAACDMRGNVQGPWHEARGEIMSDAAAIQRALIALRKKYGVMMLLADFFSRLSGRYQKRAYLRIVPTS